MGYTWGLASMGQLGHCSLRSGDKELLPRRVVALDGVFVKDVSCGGVHTCALTETGALYAWGGGVAGQLGLGPLTGFFPCSLNESETMLRNIPIMVIPTNVQLVAFGHSHTLICTKDGRRATTATARLLMRILRTLGILLQLIGVWGKFGSWLPEVAIQPC